MKLVSADRDGRPSLWAEVADGRFVAVDELVAEAALHNLRDVADLLAGGDMLVAALAECLQMVDSTTVISQHLEALQLYSPVNNPPKLICVGHNYRAHVEEGGQDLPTEPLLFSKTSNAVTAHCRPVAYPAGLTQRFDYEGELGLIIGTSTSWVDESEAMSHVAGYTIVNDLSARDLQHGSSQWFRGKSLDGLAPIGPMFVSRDEVGEPASFWLETKVNREVRQSASCGDMIFSPAQLVSFISRGITLEPGDVVATGTPAGVGLGFDPPRYLQTGDVIEVSISGLGTLITPIST